MRLQGKTAWITGAARGVGRATALAFAKEGADLLLTDLETTIDLVPYPLGDRHLLEETAQMCREFGRNVVVCTADVRKQNELQQAVQQGLAELGKLDILVNNAGVVGPGGKAAHAFTEEEWDVVVDIDLNGVWRASKAVLPHMMSRRSGAIVNISSTGGVIAFRAFASYVAAKHGVIGLTKALAADYALYGIRVNNVCPTSVYDEESLSSQMLSGVAEMYHVPLDEYEKTSKQGHPLHTLVQGEDVANACLFLASDDAKRVTGTTLMVDAGYTLK